MTFIAVILSISALLTALGTVFFRNPIWSALFLIGNLLSIAGIYASLNAHFLAVVQIVVYAGAVMVLVLFVLMLLNLKDDPGNPLKLPAFWIMASVGLCFVLVALPAFNRVLAGVSVYELSKNNLDIVGSPILIGRALFTNYVVPFEAASLLILIGVVGAVMLARRRTGGV